MRRITVETEVEIDLDDHMHEIKSSELISELKAREDMPYEFTGAHYVLLENLYYALRDKDIDAATRIVNPLLDEKIGRQV